MGILLYLILLFVWGLIVGGLARLALPGPDPMSLPATAGIGIAGSFIGGLLLWAVTGNRNGAGFVVSAQERRRLDVVAQDVPRRLRPAVVRDEALVVDRVALDALAQRAAVPVRLDRELAQRPVDRAAQRRLARHDPEHVARVDRL